MHIEYYKEFVVLAKLLNYSAASERLFISQPVLSRHIKSLEEYLGFPLFERSTQKVKLTHRGHELFEDMQIVLDKYDFIIKKHSQLDQTLTITIGVPHFAINDYLRNIPFIIESKHKNLSLNFITSDPYELINKVMNESIDMIIIPHLSIVATKQLEFFDLYEERLGVLVNINNPISQKEFLSIDDIANEQILSVHDDYFASILDIIFASFAEHNIAANPPILLNQMESILIEINNGKGISINGSHMKNVLMNNIKLIPFRDEKMSRKISLCYKPDNKNPAISIIKRAFGEAFHEERKVII